ncbi:DUF4265 domain-containing protein [Nonomuraea jabiensis]|uniref:DUF4265 domain-containing protein n=1 Tax=Nonomuraea jabiensis TaxID=882448 RepID=UPI00344629BB
MMPVSDRVKVLFHLDRDGDGWPPVGAESVWGELTEDPHVVRLANVPFFVRGVAWGDEVRIRQADADGLREYESLVRESGHSTVRIVFHDEARAAEVCARLADLGCDWEGVSAFPNLIAVNIPPELPYGGLRAWLDENRAAGLFDFEEGCISDRHRAAWQQVSQ